VRRKADATHNPRVMAALCSAFQGLAVGAPAASSLGFKRAVAGFTQPSVGALPPTRVTGMLAFSGSENPRTGMYLTQETWVKNNVLVTSLL